MVDRDATTLSPPPPAPPEKRDLDAEHKQLTLELADHPDPKVRILAHISTRQFELSERVSALQTSVNEGLEALGRQMSEGFRDMRDRIAALDTGFTDIEERTSNLEERRSLNGSSSQTQ